MIGQPPQEVKDLLDLSNKEYLGRSRTDILLAMLILAVRDLERAVRGTS